MFYVSVLVACLLSLPRGQGEPRTTTRKYKPVIQVTEEININDITFTTSAPDFDRSAFYGATKGDHTPSLFPHVTYKDSYGVTVPVEKIYSTGQPLVAPAVKYKPYKVIKVHDGFRPVTYKSRAHEKDKLSFEPPVTYNTLEPLKFSAKVPSHTFSPTVLAHLNSQNSQKLSESSDIKPFTTQRVVDWPTPTKKPYHIKKGKKLPENHRVLEDFSAAPEKLYPENPNPAALYKESPQQSESFLSEISTFHKGGSSANNLDDVADSMDLKTGERVEFQMYGMDGPQSYKFGFDTGKGHNRHFRFEERDNTGKVKGHYGYLDEDGKMRIMKYEADPITGFHAGPVEISPDDN